MCGLVINLSVLFLLSNYCIILFCVLLQSLNGNSLKKIKKIRAEVGLDVVTLNWLRLRSMASPLSCLLSPRELPSPILIIGLLPSGGLHRVAKVGETFSSNVLHLVLPKSTIFEQIPIEEKGDNIE